MNILISYRVAVLLGFVLYTVLIIIIVLVHESVRPEHLGRKQLPYMYTLYMHLKYYILIMYIKNI